MHHLTRRTLAALGALAAVTGLALAAPSAATADDNPTEFQLPIAYDVNGVTHVAGGVNADATLGPAELNQKLGAETGHLTEGTLPLPPTPITFTALGVVPLRSTINFIQSGPVTGAILSDGGPPTVEADAKYYIKLTNIQVQVAGQWSDLQVGDRCQTVAPVDIPVATPPGEYFDTSVGGDLIGTYTIGTFANCAPLMLPDVFGIGSIGVNALVPNPNNTVRLTLSNRRVVE